MTLLGQVLGDVPAGLAAAPVKKMRMCRSNHRDGPTLPVRSDSHLASVRMNSTARPDGS
jgi:hypothetical protein